MNRWAIVVASVLALVVAGCGDESDSPEDLEATITAQSAALNAQGTESALRGTIAALEAAGAQQEESALGATSVAENATVVASAFEDTPADEVLEPGHPWRKSGLELVLTANVMNENERLGRPAGVAFDFEFENNSEGNIPLRYGQENFAAWIQDGESLTVQWSRILNSLDPDFQPIPDQSLLLTPGATHEFAGTAYVVVDITRPDARNLIVEVSNVGYIIRARWRIPIHG